MPFMQHMS